MVMTVEPKLHFINWQQDPFGNFLARVVIPEATEVFDVTVDLVADMIPEAATRELVLVENPATLYDFT